jgi:hypothetical protein
MPLNDESEGILNFNQENFPQICLYCISTQPDRVTAPHKCVTISIKGHAIARVVSRWLPTVAARVRFQSGYVGFVVDKVVLGQVFSVYFGFPCQSSFHQILLLHNQLGQVQ